VKVGFLHVGADTRLAKIMTRSCLDFGYELIQMTDNETPAIDGCEVVRVPWDKTRLMTYRLKHLADLAEPDLCVLDTDTVVLKDISDVWGDWDLALTKRGPTVSAATGVDVSVDMPYNIGVMFVRNPAVWDHAHRHCAMLSYEHQTWWGDQLAMKAASDAFRLHALDSSEWNRTPRTEDESPDARVLHFKGPRKAWMLRKWQSLTTAN
jgi:hypothetical protein